MADDDIMVRVECDLETMRDVDAHARFDLWCKARMLKECRDLDCVFDEMKFTIDRLARDREGPGTNAQPFLLRHPRIPRRHNFLYRLWKRLR